MSASFPIVGIGASAGGLDAFHSFLEAMTPNCGMAFVMILHLPADRKSQLPEILARWTSMEVVEGVDGALIKPNCVYVPPPHSIVTLTNGRLGVQMPAGDDRKVARPIDAFFGVLGSTMRESAVGIVLSGTGNDGALGLKAIKQSGGLTIAQASNGDAPQYDEMPSGAIATGSVDLVLPIEKIPEELLRLRGSHLSALEEHDSAEHIEVVRLTICSILRAQMGHDFSGYRDKTFLRRVHRRMQVLGVEQLDAYVDWLRTHPDETVLLFRDLLIRVTSFFRDKQTFEALEKLVIPRLFANKNADGVVRLWIPGCATGEEAYSLAILAHEYFSKMRGPPKVQIFATDIDESAIAVARLGRYPGNLLEDLTPERRERYFIASQGSFVVSKDIRDLCTFSAHNVVRDPPFSRMDLVSCRNLLIYMNTGLQNIVIPLFHYALVEHGILLLGGAESAARHEDLFSPLDKGSRIFERREGRSLSLNLGSHLPDFISHRKLPELPNPRLPHMKSPSVKPSEKLPQGDHVDPSSASTSRAAHAGSATAKGSWMTAVTSLFTTKGSRQTEQELQGIRDEYQALSEEHQTALEELRSSNEELHSVNEEMQSANEELETSKEELQSVNEELHTVNARLTEKVDELDATNSDLRNLFESTQIATIFLDRFLVIRSFTPAIAMLYNLIPSDQGRPLTDIVTRLNYRDMGSDVALVLETLQPLERRVAHKDGIAHFIMRILPYRAPDSTVTGVLVTFVDVTSIVEAENALKDADIRKDVFLATLSHELRNPLAPIRTAAMLLNSQEISREELSRAQSIISRQVRHMSSLLEDLLDVSRITNGTFSLKREYVDVQTLLDAAIETVQPAIKERGHALVVENLSEPVTLDVDPVRISQVISNILTNATKYTPNGGTIRITSKLNVDTFSIVVKDNGVGFSQHAQTSIFNMFTRLDAEADRSEGGLGIGLALSKELMLLHGGDIDARSGGEGEGSEFTIRLPRSRVVDRASVPALAPSGPAPALSTLRVLIVDDNHDGADSLAMFLRLEGHDTLVAHSGKEGFDIAASAHVDVAVLDIGLPDMTGYELAIKMRNEPWGVRMRLIALTGWGQEEDKREAVLAGFDHHFTKPVDPTALQSALALGPSN